MYIWIDSPVVALGTDSDCQGLATLQSEPSATSASIFSRTSEVQGIRFGGQFMDQYHTGEFSIVSHH